ncbi:E3 ubiquitin-protein ligase TRIM71-like [Acropora muricata]|uniref:E3 ubiquitin-protein ligase TRIM71-like n=1 Tax=Acropora muricata TaxID=159855 RepID=UPI0034E477E7
MSERSLNFWFRLAFRLLVSDKWEKVKDLVEGNDATYRWLKEQILTAIREIVEKSFRSFLGSAALNLRDRLIALKYVNLDEETYNKTKFWLGQETGKFAFEDSDNSTEDRVVACKIALLEAAFINYDQPVVATRSFRSLLRKLNGIVAVHSTIKDKNNPSFLAQVKTIDDAAKEYIVSLGQEIHDWPEFDIPAEVLSGDSPEYQTPDIWCFGDYGMADGQISYPEKVAIDKEGHFLVLEENVIGVGDVITIQRIQLFDYNGKFLKCLLQRGQGKVNGMADFCLTQDGNLLVADEDGDNMSRIQIFDYEGNQLLQIAPCSEGESSLKIRPKFMHLTIDHEGRIIAGDTSGFSVHVFGIDGKVVSKFGKFGRNEGDFQSIDAVSCDKMGKIYVADSVRRQIQVLDTDGNFLSLFGPRGTYLRYMFFDAARKEVFGTDYENHKIRVYSEEGEPLREHGKFGTTLNECWFPYGLAQLPDGKIAIAERENHRITVLKI